jgi:AcrR family transcriptional regulator
MISPSKATARTIPSATSHRCPLLAVPRSGPWPARSALWGEGGGSATWVSLPVRAGWSPERPRSYRDNLSLSNQDVSVLVAAYTSRVPKLWTETIQAHRREVRDAILDTTAALVAEHGLLAVTMSQIAKETGIGRATLYKYFPDVEAILLAWHDRQISAHLAYLADVRGQAVGAAERLQAVLEAYALLSRDARGHHDTDYAAFLHRDQRVARAQHQVHRMLRDLLIEATKTGDVREDVPPDELASYCLHALGGASSQRSKAAVRRLVSVTLAGLRPDSS